ncbi:transporter [Ganoderma sinense ZZ0214-1]|uniref:Transporter n=1 Tax=Ganoderma sinense ZZ0214-1 TaxID=1077348 RepID=A0A2G8RYY7_9APHY|nr:transporter [Ganoderma sinense ZZ0214-1]
MTIFRSQGPRFVPPRDDITLPQFILDDVGAERTRPVRPAHVPCLIDSETGKIVYLEELRARSHALARSLKARYNIGVGNVVSLFIPNHIDYGVIIWAVHRLGGSAAAHSSTLTAEEFAYQLGITEPSLVVAYPSNCDVALAAMKMCNIPQNRLVLLDGHLTPGSPFPSLESLIEEHDGHPPYVEYKLKPGEAKSAIALLCFSSGTTGNPKAVAVSHYNAICAIVQTAMINLIYEQYAPWRDQRFRPGDVGDGNGSVGSMVPAQAVLLCKHPLTKNYDLSSVRSCLTGAAPLSPEMHAELTKLFPDSHFGQGYGMTETSCIIATVSPAPTIRPHRHFTPLAHGVADPASAPPQFPVSMKVSDPGSVGQLAPGTSAQVVKADGTLAGVGECGELLVHGPQIVLGYYRNPKATEEAFDDGWLRTGDEVKFDAEGNIFITDRIKIVNQDLIKVKGLQVAPSELEGYLLGHPDVADAAVIGVPDEYAGELPRAFVVLKPEVADAVQKDRRLVVRVKENLYNAVASRAARYKRLDGGVELVDAIPKNGSGKILRRVLRDLSQRARARL